MDSGLLEESLVRFIHVDSVKERFSLKKEEVCKGDLVFQIHPDRIFVVTDTSNLDSEKGYSLLHKGSRGGKNEIQ